MQSFIRMIGWWWFWLNMANYKACAWEEQTSQLLACSSSQGKQRSPWLFPWTDRRSRWRSLIRSGQWWVPRERLGSALWSEREIRARRGSPEGDVRARFFRERNPDSSWGVPLVAVELGGTQESWRSLLSLQLLIPLHYVQNHMVRISILSYLTYMIKIDSNWPKLVKS